jgi:hypothetical protein
VTLTLAIFSNGTTITPVPVKLPPEPSAFVTITLKFPAVITSPINSISSGEELSTGGTIDCFPQE